MTAENRLRLTARIIEREAVRYTPAGIPVIATRLWHRSQQWEAEIGRNVEFEIPAIVIGDISESFAKLETGPFYHFTGFLAAKSLKSRNLLFHITGFSSIE
ncbi:primosomal replication protein N [Oxalobacter sp. OxGP1]|nr:primosomal replication protein N [Oxalobacter paeniformigenes]MCZ4053192.1 primosomal replication protein N [Oxalobacter paeniformigenes]